MSQDNTTIESPTPKRRGNPNWVKKNEGQKLVPPPPGSNGMGLNKSINAIGEQLNVSIPDDAAWLELYGNILTSYNVGGEAVAIAAAKTADFALAEFRKRYPK